MVRERKSVKRLTCLRWEMLSVWKLRKGGLRCRRRDGYKSTPRPSAMAASHLLPVTLTWCQPAQMLRCRAALPPPQRTASRQMADGVLLVIEACTTRTVRCSPAASARRQSQRQCLVMDLVCRCRVDPHALVRGSASQFEQAAIEASSR